SMPRKELDALTEEVKGIGAGGLPYVKVGSEGSKTVLTTGVAKFFNEGQTAELIEMTGATPGDQGFFAAGSEANVFKWLAWLGPELAQRRNLIPANEWRFVWVVDFPLFGWNEEEKAVYSMHPPFTSPRDEDLPLLKIGSPEIPPAADILKVKA